MILRPRLSHLLVSLYLCTSLTSAWPWPPSFRGLEDILVRRQDNSKDFTKPSAKATSSQPSKTSAAASASKTGKAGATTGKAGTTTGKAGATKTTGKGSAQTGDKEDDDVDPGLPPGGVNMITPSALATSTYYKIGVDSVSFVWNYTSLEVTPSKIDILVTCTGNQATYTLASNQSFDKTGSVVWDTKPELTGSSRLLTDKYTLIIHDSEMALTDRPEAGHLGSYNQLTFGMYIPQKYTPRTEWKCPTCNDALSDTGRYAIKFVTAMCGITILSFTWFVGGFGALL